MAYHFNITIYTWGAFYHSVFLPFCLSIVLPFCRSCHAHFSIHHIFVWFVKLTIKPLRTARFANCDTKWVVETEILREVPDVQTRTEWRSWTFFAVLYEAMWKIKYIWQLQAVRPSAVTTCLFLIRILNWHSSVCAFRGTGFAWLL